MRKHLFAINLCIIASMALMTTVFALFTFVAHANSRQSDLVFMPNIILYPILTFMLWSSFALVLVFASKVKLAAKIINIVTTTTTLFFGLYSFIFIVGHISVSDIGYYGDRLGSLVAYYFPAWVSFYMILFILGIVHLVFAILLFTMKNKDESSLEKTATPKKEEVVYETQSTTGDVLATLKELKELLDNNAITEDEYAVLKQKELNKL